MTPLSIRRVGAAAAAAGRPFVDYLDQDAHASFSQLVVPVFALWGANDLSAPVASAHEQLKRVVTTPVTASVLPDAGHDIAPHLWAPDAAHWLRKLPDSAQELTRGAQPATSLEATTPPRASWHLDPRTHAALALGLTILFLFIRFHVKGHRA